MENNSKLDAGNTNEAAVGSNMEVMDHQRLRKVNSHDIIVRILALLLTLIATIIVATDKESKIIPVPVFPNLPPFQVPVTAKWQYMSASVFFLVSNAIACLYAAGSLIYWTAKSKRGKGLLVVVIIVLDMLVMGLLSSANGAIAAVGVIGRYGNSHTRWNKVCNVFSVYCNHLTVALVLSLLATSLFLSLVSLAAFNLHTKSIS